MFYSKNDFLNKDFPWKLFVARIVVSLSGCRIRNCWFFANPPATQSVIRCCDLHLPKHMSIQRLVIRVCACEIACLWPSVCVCLWVWVWVWVYICVSVWDWVFVCVCVCVREIVCVCVGELLCLCVCFVVFVPVFSQQMTVLIWSTFSLPMRRNTIWNSQLRNVNALDRATGSWGRGFPWAEVRWDSLAFYRSSYRFLSYSDL